MIRATLLLLTCSAVSVMAHPVQHDVLGIHHGAVAPIALAAIAFGAWMVRGLLSQRR